MVKEITVTTQMTNLKLQSMQSKITMSERKASLTFGIPRSTIQNKLNGKHFKNIGGQITFAQQEEELFAIRIMKMCEWGFPVDIADLRMIVSVYLENQKHIIPKFRNNIPGDDWARNFMERWELRHRLVTNIRRKHAKVTKEQWEKYFQNIEKELEGIPP